MKNSKGWRSYAPAQIAGHEEIRDRVVIVREVDDESATVEVDDETYEVAADRLLAIRSTWHYVSTETGYQPETVLHPLSSKDHGALVEGRDYVSRRAEVGR